MWGIFTKQQGGDTPRRRAGVASLVLAGALLGVFGPGALRADDSPGATGWSKEDLARQHFAAAPLPTPWEAVALAAEAAKRMATPLLDKTFHAGKRLAVPEQYPTIQAALDVADSGDQVVVAAGVYYEQLFLRDGVKLSSAVGTDGEELVAVPGAEQLQLPRRALRTIIDGAKAEVSPFGMLNFSGSVGRQTIVDGFTIRHLPARNHHLPGHAHAVNLRGASPVITNCNVRHNGSTGIGSHVVFQDQDLPFAERDFRRANIQTEAAALIYHNVVGNNLGRGIGANEFSSPLIFGNEIFANEDVELGDDPGPGIGAKHGANPTIVGNVIHHHPRGGIRIKEGDAQGRVGIDQAPRADIRANVIYANGQEKPAIALSGAGTRTNPTRIVGNYLYDSGAMAISLEQGSVAIVEENLIVGGKGGVAVEESTALKLNKNTIARIAGVGIYAKGEGAIEEMVDNVLFAVDGVGFSRPGGGK